ncbi:MAG: choice-of-anchor L domain-containing protein [Rhodospirillaceae bacterium]
MVGSTPFDVSDTSIRWIVTGDAGDNTILTGSNHDTITGGDGADWLDGGSGADTITGGGGDDTIVYRGSVAGETLDGGTGTDTLLVNSGGLDLTTTSTVLRSLEQISLSTGTLTISQASVAALSGSTLRILADDGVVISDATGAAWAFTGNEIVDGVGYGLWTNGSVTLHIDSAADTSSLNARPVLAPSAVTATQADTATPTVWTVGALLAGRVTDTAGSLNGMAVTGGTGSGTWEWSLDGSSWTTLPSLSAGNAVLLGPDAMVRFVPTPESTGSAALSFRAWDVSEGSAGTTVATATLGTAISTGGTSLNLTITDGSLTEDGYGNDLPEGVTTPASMQVGDRFTGTLSEDGTGSLVGPYDGDAIGVTLEAGVTYIIRMLGGYNDGIPSDWPAYGGTLDDPYIYLLDGNGAILEGRDDNGIYYNALIEHTAGTSGTHFIHATSYNWSWSSNWGVTGSYTVTFTEGIVVNGAGEVFDGDAAGTTHADTIRLDAGSQTVDLTDASWAPWTNIEVIDAVDSGTETLLLDHAAVVRLTDSGNRLRIFADGSDTVRFLDDGWSVSGTETIDGFVHDLYTNNGATVAVNQVVSVSVTASLGAALAYSSLGHLDGVTVDEGSISFQGNVTAGQESASTFGSLALGAIGNTSYNLSRGILITSGSGTPGTVNTSDSYSQTASGSSSAALDALGYTTTDTSALTFTFTVEEGVNGIVLDWMFGTEEFPSQSVSDIAAIFLDGQNILALPEGSPVAWQPGAAGYFGDNGAYNGSHPLATEYNGVTTPASALLRLDPGITTHTLTIAVSDTTDISFDSGLFIAPRAVARSTGTYDDNVIFGTAGDDTLYAYDGNDIIFGFEGNDTLHGDWGNDTLSGGMGNDILYGGYGADVFHFGFGDGATVAERVFSLGTDSLYDFSALEGDTIQLGNGTFGLGSDGTLTDGITFGTMTVPLSSAPAVIGAAGQAGIVVVEANGTSEVWFTEDMGAVSTATSYQIATVDAPSTDLSAETFRLTAT